MKIESVNVTVFQYPTRRVSDSAGHSHPGPESMAKMAMLTITADDGSQGFSFAPPEVVRPFVVNTFFRKVMVGQDPFNRERIWQDLAHWQRGSAHQLTERALSFVEQALWDLIGRKLNVPVYKLLGGFRDKVPAYGSTMCGDDLPGSPPRKSTPPLPKLWSPVAIRRSSSTHGCRRSLSHLTRKWTLRPAPPCAKRSGRIST